VLANAGLCEKAPKGEESPRRRADVSPWKIVEVIVAVISGVE
jgi:hypothetical protein